MTSTLRVDGTRARGRPSLLALAIVTNPDARVRGLWSVQRHVAGASGRRLWRGWGWRIVLGQRGIVRRRRNVGGNRIGEVGAPTNPNPPANAGAHVGPCHTRGLHCGDNFGDGRNRQHSQDGRGPSSPIHLRSPSRTSAPSLRSLSRERSQDRSISTSGAAKPGIRSVWPTRSTGAAYCLQGG